jgi:transposase
MNKMKDCIVRGKRIFIGLEDSKLSWKISSRSEKTEVHYTSMSADYEVLRNYLRKNYPECEIKIMYEAGFKGFGLYYRLVEDGYACVVTPPNKVTQEKDSRVKTDKIDCRRLAITLENGDYKSCHIPDKERLEDRQISRTLIAIQKDITRTKNRIRKFLDFHWVGGFPAGAWRVRDYNRLMMLELGGALGISLNVFKEQLQHLLATKQQLMQELKALSNKERYAKTCKIVESAPGVGWFTAIRFVLEVGEDLSRFKDGKHFASYLGLTGSEFSTGGTIRRGHITHQGSGHLRAWLTECAWSAKSRDPVLLHKYMSILHRSNKEEDKKKAMIAVVRKLAVRLWRCVVNGEPYRIGLIETC